LKYSLRRSRKHPMVLGENELAQEIDNKYLLSDLYLVLVNIEFNVIEKVKKGILLGKEDDIDLLVPALTSSLSCKSSNMSTRYQNTQHFCWV